MEQDIQQNIQKPPFPMKTKIAAWWMIVISILAILNIEANMDMAIFVLLIPSLIQILFCFFILKRKKWAWYASLVIIFILLVFQVKIGFFIYDPLYSYFWSHRVFDRDIQFIILKDLKYFFSTYSFLILLIPLILLFLDRKNFCKIAK
jgi:hypothetical protein